jgi:hypothetical protein
MLVAVPCKGMPGVGDGRTGFRSQSEAQASAWRLHEVMYVISSQPCLAVIVALLQRVLVARQYLHANTISLCIAAPPPT